MSGKKETVKNEVAAVAPNEVAAANTEFQKALNGGNLAEILDSKTKAGFSLTSEYLKMEEGETDRFFAAKLSTMEVDDEDSDIKGAKKDVPCVLLVNSQESTVSAAQTVIVNSLKAHLPCFVEITCKGRIELAGGKGYTGFNVSLLD